MSNGDVVYVVQSDGPDRKFKVKDASMSAGGFTLADATNSANAPPRARRRAGRRRRVLPHVDRLSGQVARESSGSRYSIIFEVTSADLRTLKAYPANRNAQGISTSFRGNGYAAYTAPNVLRRLATSSSPSGSDGDSLESSRRHRARQQQLGGFRLKDNTGSGHQTPRMGWAVPATTMRDNIEAQFTGFDEVSVERNGDASAAYNYGYTYTIFFGESTRRRPSTRRSQPRRRPQRLQRLHT